jgi:hypothetical protein
MEFRNIGDEIPQLGVHLPEGPHFVFTAARDIFSGARAPGHQISSGIQTCSLTISNMAMIYGKARL